MRVRKALQCDSEEEITPDLFVRDESRLLKKGKGELEKKPCERKTDINRALKRVRMYFKIFLLKICHKKLLNYIGIRDACVCVGLLYFGGYFSFN